jgi:hypothetical protein
MSKMSLFGERSLTLVAATFSERVTAVAAATALQAELPRTEVDLLHPRDANFARKMEPESHGIWRTAIRSHLVLGPVGLGLGAVVAAMLVGVGWPAAVTSPMLATVFLSAFGLFAGLMVAGLLTLRPDRGHVLTSIRESNGSGDWAVVAHPTSPAQSERAIASLRKAGGMVVWSL